jgi:hypothetical protein
MRATLWSRATLSTSLPSVEASVDGREGEGPVLALILPWVGLRWMVQITSRLLTHSKP